MISCDDIKEKISLLIDNELNEAQAAEVNEHLKRCKACKAYYDELKKITEEINKLEDSIDFPNELHSRIMTEIKANANDTKEKSKKKNIFELKNISLIIPTAACFVLMCVVTVVLTDMQNNKAISQQNAINSQIVDNSGNNAEDSTDKQIAMADDPNIAREGEPSAVAGAYEKKDIAIIIDKKDIKLSLAKNEENLRKLEEICQQYDYEAVADSESFSVSLKVLKDTDYDKFIKEINELNGNAVAIKEYSEDKTQEYNKLFEEIDANKANNSQKLNELYEKAFNLEMDMDYYEIKVELN